MAVRAKMRCTRVAPQTAGGYSKEVSVVEIILQPVYGNSDDDANKEWSKYTPSGQVNLTITNLEAAKQFKIGEAYFVDFTPAND